MEQRVLIKFARGGYLRFLSHLEISRAIERALRRAALPLAFSQGFNPHPRMSFWHALPVGAGAEGDLLEVWLAEGQDLVEVARKLSGTLPPGLEMLEVSEVPAEKPKLTKRFTHALYTLTWDSEGAGSEPGNEGNKQAHGEIFKAVRNQSGQTEVWLLVCQSEGGLRLRHLTAQAADDLGIGPESARIVRKGLYESREQALAVCGGLSPYVNEI